MHRRHDEEEMICKVKSRFKANHLRLATALLPPFLVQQAQSPLIVLVLVEMIDRKNQANAFPCWTICHCLAFVEVPGTDFKPTSLKYLSHKSHCISSSCLSLNKHSLFHPASPGRFTLQPWSPGREISPFYLVQSP